MRFGTKAFATLCLVAVGIVLVLPSAAATTYTVDSNPYVVNHTLSSSDLWDSYELTAANGAHVAYSVTVSGGGCVMLLFVKGHSVTMSSTYYIAYSEANCVSSYSNTFPVGSNDGTEFSVLIATTSMTDVPYSVNVNVQPPSALGAILGFVAIIVIVVVVAVVLLLMRRRKAAKAPPPAMMPPSYGTMPPPAYPPQQPPQQPPMQPGTPP